jgi:hypothetical protein
MTLLTVIVAFAFVAIGIIADAIVTAHRLRPRRRLPFHPRCR